MFGIGFYYFLKVKNADDYLIGGWSMGFWPIVGTVISTWCGASVFIGTVGLGFQVGASGYIRFSLASVIFTLILILAFGRALRRQRLYTLADLFGQRFGVRAGIIPSLLSAVVYAIPTTAMQYLAMSTIWSACFGMDVGNALVLSAVLVLAFTVLGGLPGTIVTDALQAVLIITGIVILAVASVSLAGGMGPNTLKPFTVRNAAGNSKTFTFNNPSSQAIDGLQMRDGLFPAAFSSGRGGASLWNTAYSTMFWGGLTGEVTAFSPFRVSWDFIYGSVDNGREYLNRQGWFGMLLGEYDTDWGVPGLYGWYFSVSIFISAATTTIRTTVPSACPTSPPPTT